MVTFDIFLEDGLKSLAEGNFEYFDGMLDYYYNQISEAEFSFYEFYHGIAEFIKYLIDRRAAEIGKGNSIKELDNCLAFLIKDAINSFDNSVFKEELAKIDDDGNIDSLIESYSKLSKRRFQRIVYTNTPDLIYGAENPNKVCIIPSNILREFYALGQSIYTCFKQHDSSLEHCNIAIANLGFITTDRIHKKAGGDSNHRRTLCNIPLLIEGRNIVCISDFTKDTYQAVQARLDAGKMVLQAKAPTKKDIIDKTEAIASKSDDSFFKKFHHSEQAIFEALKTENVIAYIINQLKKNGVSPGYKVYAVILDIYTTRDFCKRCGHAIIGIQNGHSTEFLNKLNAALRIAGYVISEQERTKIGKMKRHGFGHIEKTPGLCMVARGIHDHDYLDTGLSAEEKEYLQDENPSDIRYFNKTAFMVKHAKLNMATRAANVARLSSYSIFSSRRPTPEMAAALKTFNKKSSAMEYSASSSGGSNANQLGATAGIGIKRINDVPIESLDPDNTKTQKKGNESPDSIIHKHI